ncbi:unnamed protein product [Caenorhabditis auriculariae]|uniref:ACB domain-containing protein n=1 Tax=Caenorhabditis auriculariae TaxID=2777116 RepID=A0A8S1GWM7_9PELO|nr:unnamed protein product [Caenorhabditis auriculariae]
MSQDEAKALYVETILGLCDRAEEEHDIMDFLSNPKFVNDPHYIELLKQQDVFRDKFALLGRTHTKGHKGEMVVINGVSVAL